MGTLWWSVRVPVSFSCCGEASSPVWVTHEEGANAIIYLVGQEQWEHLRPFWCLSEDAEVMQYLQCSCCPWVTWVLTALTVSFLDRESGLCSPLWAPYTTLGNFDDKSFTAQLRVMNQNICLYPRSSFFYFIFSLRNISPSTQICPTDSLQRFRAATWKKNRWCWSK